MGKNASVLISVGAIGGMAHLPDAEKWEGADTFEKTRKMRNVKRAPINCKSSGIKKALLAGLLWVINCATTHPSTLGAGLEGKYTFDNGTARDASGNNNHGTAYNANTTVGVQGLGLRFNGINSIVEIPVLIPRYTTSGTIFGWYRSDPDPDLSLISEYGVIAAAYQTIFGQNRKQNDYAPGLFVTIWNRSEIENNIYESSGYTIRSGFSDEYPGNSNWHNIVLESQPVNRFALNANWHSVATTIASGSDGKILKLYFDGRLVGTTRFDNPTSEAFTDGEFYIGGSADAAFPKSSFHGSIDNVYVYSRALDDAEVASLHILTGSAVPRKKWEGTDDFSSANLSAASWKPMGKTKKSFQYVYEGQMRCTFVNEQSDQWWAWGKNIHKIPTAANWTVSAEVYLPQSSPIGSAADRCKAGFGVGALPNGKQAITLKMRRSFKEGTFAISVDADYSAGKDDETLTETSFYDRYLIFFTHDALLQTDSIEVSGQNGASPPVSLLNQPPFRTQLSRSTTAGLGAVVSGKPNWPKNNNTLGLDNWSVVENNPDPIHLNPQNSTSKGIAYSVSVTSLDLVNQKLAGTVALTVGTVSATLPITGSIDKNGHFALTAKGKGTNRGFGCTLLYDVATGTYRPNKNTLTAPNQKAIKF